MRAQGSRRASDTRGVTWRRALQRRLRSGGARRSARESLAAALHTRAARAGDTSKRVLPAPRRPGQPVVPPAARPASPPAPPSLHFLTGGGDVRAPEGLACRVPASGADEGSGPLARYAVSRRTRAQRATHAPGVWRLAAEHGAARRRGAGGRMNCMKWHHVVIGSTQAFTRPIIMQCAQHNQPPVRQPHSRASQLPQRGKRARR
jgi:hypothetical protein